MHYKIQKRVKTNQENKNMIKLVGGFLVVNLGDFSKLLFCFKIEGKLNFMQRGKTFVGK